MHEPTLLVHAEPRKAVGAPTEYEVPAVVVVSSGVSRKISIPRNLQVSIRRSESSGANSLNRELESARIRGIRD
jgi:hypothetical protein